jgi:hypothetical protein
MCGVEAHEIRHLVVTAMDAAGMSRARGARWFVTSDELTWVFELDRGAAWSRRAMTVGAAVRAWTGDEAIRRANNGHVVVDYALFGSAVPDEAVGTRFDDHRSYFTMMFDHMHDLVTVDERLRSFEWMAKDLGHLTHEHTTVDALRQAVSVGSFESGFVDRRLR